MQRGFTLIELLVVIAVLGIVAALALPRIGNTVAQRDLENAARELEADLRWMQQLSINSGGGALPLLQFNNASPYGYYITLNTRSIKAVTFPATVQINSNPGNIQFDMNGYPINGITITLQSTTISNNFRYIYIEQLTGRVRVQ